MFFSDVNSLDIWANDFPIKFGQFIDKYFSGKSKEEFYSSFYFKAGNLFYDKKISHRVIIEYVSEIYLSTISSFSCSDLNWLEKLKIQIFENDIYEFNLKDFVRRNGFTFMTLKIFDYNQ